MIAWMIPSKPKVATTGAIITIGPDLILLKIGLIKNLSITAPRIAPLTTATSKANQ